MHPSQSQLLLLLAYSYCLNKYIFFLFSFRYSCLHLLADDLIILVCIVHPNIFKVKFKYFFIFQINILTWNLSTWTIFAVNAVTLVLRSWGCGPSPTTNCCTCGLGLTGNIIDKDDIIYSCITRLKIICAFNSLNCNCFTICFNAASYPGISYKGIFNDLFFLSSNFCLIIPSIDPKSSIFHLISSSSFILNSVNPAFFCKSWYKHIFQA